MSAVPRTAGQELPGKDANTFKALVKLYEEKRYKKALKLTEQLLKKYPEHGETVSMRGIICWYIPERKEEALGLAKKGVRLNLSSFLCWHVLGLIRRNGREYDEAMRCFRQAARLNAGNPLLWRDLSTLQIHQGNVAGFLESRKSLFFSRPNVKAHWTSYAFAQHINGHLELARRLLQTTISHFKQTERSAASSPEEIAETSELLLYEAQLLEEEGKFPDAIEVLSSNPQVHDKISRLESLGRLFVYLGKYTEAHSAFMELFKRQRANRLSLLCALATHPTFVPVVEFPRVPGCPGKQGGIAPLPRSGPDPYLPRGSQSGNSRGLWLRLSPLPLKSPLLAGPPSPTWQTHPPHLIFPELAPNFGPFRRENAEFQVLRSLTEEEEEAMSRWMLSEVKSAVVEFSKSICKLLIDVFDYGAGDSFGDTALRLLLEFVEDPARFLFYLDKLIRRKILKGTPFFCCVLEGLACVPRKAALIRQLLETFLLALDRNDRIPLGTPPMAPPELRHTAKGCDQCLEEEVGLASAAFRSSLRTIILLGLAQLADYTEEPVRAMKMLEQAIAITPTLSELYLLKSRLLKHMGSREAAVETLCEGREMDLADRFLNTKAVKYFLNINDVETAATLSLYFSNENNIVDLQSMWYELRRGSALRRLGNRAEAMRDFYRIVAHFEDIRADLFDFHWYCQRRGVFRAYLQALRMRNSMGSQKFYRMAAAEIVEMLLERINVSSTEPETEIPVAVAAVTSADKSDGTSKANKKRKKAAPVSATPVISPSTPASQREAPVAASPWMRVGAEALSEAVRLTDSLAREAALWPRSHQLRFSIAKHKGRALVMMQCLHRLWRLSARNLFDPRLAPTVVEFISSRWDSQPNGSASGAVTHVWTEMLQSSQPTLSPTLVQELRSLSGCHEQRGSAYTRELFLRSQPDDITTRTSPTITATAG